jgi:hypothetical protein
MICAAIIATPVTATIAVLFVITVAATIIMYMEQLIFQSSWFPAITFAAAAQRNGQQQAVNLALLETQH